MQEFKNDKKKQKKRKIEVEIEQITLDSCAEPNAWLVQRRQ